LAALRLFSYLSRQKRAAKKARDKRACDIRARRKKSVAKKSVATKERKYNHFGTLIKLMQQRQVNKKQSGKPARTTKRKYF
jgi:hypothetical protein